MGFLDSLFGGGKKEMGELKAEMENLKSELLKSTLDTKNDINQILTIMSEFDSDLNSVKETLRSDDRSDKPPAHVERAINSLNSISLKNEKGIEELRRRMANLEKIAANFKAVGKLSIHNYDLLKAVQQKARKMDKVDELEKSILEHISLTPEAIVSKDEYTEEMRSLKKRLLELEKSELMLNPAEGERIVINSERKKAKKR